jgi:hypothetical protein
MPRPVAEPGGAGGEKGLGELLDVLRALTKRGSEISAAFRR